MGVNPWLLLPLPLEAVDLKCKQMVLADAFRAKVALVLLGLGCPQNLTWQFPLFCQFFSALKLIIFLMVYPAFFIVFSGK